VSSTQDADGGLEIEVPDAHPLQPENGKARLFSNAQMPGMIQLQNSFACMNCKKAHLSCDRQRPCGRCSSTGKQVSPIR
jgi:hypothetical protein